MQIQSDVKRSFTFYSLEEYPPEIITRILMSYAYKNPDIEYCQGMNFLVGFIFHLAKDEELSYNIFSRLLEIDNLKQMFSSETPLLRKLLFELDKLISVYSPNLFSHFIKEGINSTLFASSWMITLFTIIIQFIQLNKIPPIIIQIWNEFIVKGWKTILKSCLFIVLENEKELMNLTYEATIQYLNEFTRTDSFCKEELVIKYKAFSKKLKIPNLLLVLFDEEYEAIQKGANQSELIKNKNTNVIIDRLHQGDNIFRIEY